MGCLQPAESLNRLYLQTVTSDNKYMKKAMPLNSLVFVIVEEYIIILETSAVVMRPNHC